MRVRGEESVIGVVEGPHRSHLLTLVRGEDAEEIHPHLATHCRMDAMPGEVPQASNVHMLLRRE
jgi:hypothetical protein